MTIDHVSDSENYKYWTPSDAAASNPDNASKNRFFFVYTLIIIIIMFFNLYITFEIAYEIVLDENDTLNIYNEEKEMIVK